ncbi:hypothetical protein BN1013_02109 [Candidatus Rubidus massiliensis]|nr:hypothetical protein BN1013_02109 [Candidatus Rubidus massiliensis]
MKDVLKKIKTPYVDTQTLLVLLQEYKKPREYIRRKVINGELIRLKNGFFLIRDKIETEAGTTIPYELVANLLYGPSYVSLEWALSFYGMIPEKVYTISSMTLGRNKLFKTSIGDFAYHALSEKCYDVGITQKKNSDFIGSFFIATPEKAIIDTISKTCKGLNKYELKDELLLSQRMDEEAITQLDKKLLEQIAKVYKSRSVDNFIELVGMI